MPAWALLLLCFFVYNSNLRIIGSYDSLAASLIPFGLLRGDGVFLDRYAGTFSPGIGYSIVTSKSGHLVSLYPPVTPLLATPLYVPALLLNLEPGGPDVMRWRAPMEKLAASLLASLSVVVLYMALRKIAPPALSLVLTIAYAFGTSTWVISSQALWTHALAALLVSACILLLLDPSPRPGKLALLGLCAALVTANRPMDFFFTAAIAWIVLRREGRRSWPFFVPTAVVALALVSYNLTHFSNILGGYGEYRTPTGDALFRKVPDGGAFLGLLFSNRGLFTFSPFLLFFFLSPTGGRHPMTPLLRPLLLACLATVLLYASAAGWSGGYCYGPRYLITCLPVLTIALVHPLRQALRTRSGRILFASACGLSVAIQAIGAYCYPGGDSGNEGMGLWTVRNSSPVLAASAGPQPPDFLAIVAPGMTMNRPLRPTDAQAAYEWASPPPAIWPARARRRVGVWVWNRGPVVLSSFGGLFNRGAVVLRGTWRTDGGHSEPAQPAQGIWLSSRLSAGEAIEREIELLGPNVTGRLRLSIELFQTGVGPFSGWGSPPLETEVIVIPGREYEEPRHAAEWAALDGPKELTHGSVVDVPVRVRNVTPLPWPPGIRMSYRWRTVDGSAVGGEGLRSELPASAATAIGGIVNSRVRVDVPPGDYFLVFDLVEAGAAPRWFEEEGSPPLFIRVQVR